MRTAFACQYICALQHCRLCCLEKVLLCAFSCALRHSPDKHRSDHLSKWWQTHALQRMSIATTSFSVGNQSSNSFSFLGMLSCYCEAYK
jgi:hypothetical protein